MRAATLDFLSRHRRERRDHITDRLVASIQRENPAYRTPTVTSEDLRHSCVTNVDRILELLADAVRSDARPRPSDQDPSYDAARATGQRRAEQGVQLDDVLRSFRMGGGHVWEDLIECGEDHLDASALRIIGTRLWEVVDATSAQVAIAYHAHERALVRADEQQRAEVWEGLLGGRGRERGFADDAAMLLDLPAEADLLVVSSAGIDRSRADDRLAPHGTAWSRRTGGMVGLVALRDASPVEALAALDSVAHGSGVAVGVSSVVAGLAGVEQGFREASLALRTQGVRPGLAAFDDRLPEALLLSSPEMAARLVARWVTPLRELPSAESRALLETLTSWVAEGGSATRTAAAVHCHRNTVVNRLRRVSDLTGLRLGDEAPPLDLDLALRSDRMSKSHPAG